MPKKNTAVTLLSADIGELIVSNAKTTLKEIESSADPIEQTELLLRFFAYNTEYLQFIATLYRDSDANTEREELCAENFPDVIALAIAPHIKGQEDEFDASLWKIDSFADGCCKEYLTNVYKFDDKGAESYCFVQLFSGVAAAQHLSLVTKENKAIWEQRQTHFEVDALSEATQERLACLLERATLRTQALKIMERVQQHLVADRLSCKKWAESGEADQLQTEITAYIGKITANILPTVKLRSLIAKITHIENILKVNANHILKQSRPHIISYKWQRLRVLIFNKINKTRALAIQTDATREFLDEMIHRLEKTFGKIIRIRDLSAVPALVQFSNTTVSQLIMYHSAVVKLHTLIERGYLTQPNINEIQAALMGEHANIDDVVALAAKISTDTQIEQAEHLLDTVMGQWLDSLVEFSKSASNPDKEVTVEERKTLQKTQQALAALSKEKHLLNKHTENNASDAAMQSARKILSCREGDKIDVQRLVGFCCRDHSSTKHGVSDLFRIPSQSAARFDEVPAAVVCKA